MGNETTIGKRTRKRFPLSDNGSSWSSGRPAMLQRYDIEIVQIFGWSSAQVAISHVISGPDPTDPCTPPQSGTLAESDQITAFLIDRTTKGNSGGTGSRWIPTYDMPLCTSAGQQNCEALPGITITSPTNGLIVAVGGAVPTNYSCSNPTSSQPSTGATGPYLTTGTCTQSTGTGSCTQTANGLSPTGRGESLCVTIRSLSQTPAAARFPVQASADFASSWERILRTISREARKAAQSSREAAGRRTP